MAWQYLWTALLLLAPVLWWWWHASTHDTGKEQLALDPTRRTPFNRLVGYTRDARGAITGVDGNPGPDDVRAEMERLDLEHAAEVATIKALEKRSAEIESRQQLLLEMMGDAAIHSLTDDVLGLIFRFVAAGSSGSHRTLLLSVPCVCRQWRQVCHDEVVLDAMNLGWARGAAGDDVVRALLARFHGARSLALDRCVQLTDATLLHVARMPHLSSLGLDSCWSITDAGLRHLAGHERLKSLTLSGCRRLTDTALEHVAKLLYLAHLDLCKCNRITGTGLCHLQGHPHLDTLDLSGCDNVTDACLEHVAHIAPLTTLSLRACRNVSGPGLMHLAQLKKLTSLDLCWNQNMTDEGLGHVRSPSPFPHLSLTQKWKRVCCSDAGGRRKTCPVRANPRSRSWFLMAVCSVHAMHQQSGRPTPGANLAGPTPVHWHHRRRRGSPAAASAPHFFRPDMLQHP